MAPLASPLDVPQLTKAVNALLKFNAGGKASGKAQLIETEEPISVVFGMKTIPEKARKTKPYMM